MSSSPLTHSVTGGTSHGPVGRLRSFLRLDFPLGAAQPTLGRWALATLLALAASVAACGVLVVAATVVFPSTIGYPHFQFADYGKLTIVGVFLACCAWPVVTLVSSRARRLFFVLAVAVTIVGFAPDVWILVKGQPAEAVGVLMAMHLVLAIITYPALVLVAPQRRSGERR